MTTHAPSQCELLLDALKRGPMTAADIWLQLGIARASARVYDLRHDLEGQGLTITAETITVRNRRGQACRVALYAVAAIGSQHDLFADAREREAGRVAA